MSEGGTTFDVEPISPRGGAVIEWLNANAGAVQGVATLVLVLLTARYVALTSRVARETRLNLRPSLSADVSVEREWNHIYFAVANTGQRPATDATFRLIQASHDELESRLRALPPFMQGISYLAPGRRYHYELDRTRMEDALGGDDGQPYRFSISIDYRDGDDQFEEEVTIDLVAMNGVLYSSFDSDGTIVAKELKRMADQLRRPRINHMLRFSKRPCEFCREDVSHDAKKCPHCREWIAEPPIWRLVPWLTFRIREASAKPS